MVQQLRPTLNLIEQSIAADLGEPVQIKLQVVRGYAPGAELLLSGKADVMRLGPASYVQVKRDNADIELLAMENKNGANTFEGVIAVHEDSGITEISQLAGRTFAFGSKRSTLGRYFAQLELTRAGILASNLKSYEYLGRHDKVGPAVGAGLFAAGALEGTMFRKLQAQGVPIRAIHVMRNATKAWAARAGLNPRVKRALREALLDIHDKEALTALRFDGFLAGLDSDYDPTREAMIHNPEFFGSGS
jgi:phosphonate transport system substrate-binding protein